MFLYKLEKLFVYILLVRPNHKQLKFVERSKFVYDDIASMLFFDFEDYLDYDLCSDDDNIVSVLMLDYSSLFRLKSKKILEEQNKEKEILSILSIKNSLKESYPNLLDNNFSQPKERKVVNNKKRTLLKTQKKKEKPKSTMKLQLVGVAVLNTSYIAKLKQNSTPAKLIAECTKVSTMVEKIEKSAPPTPSNLMKMIDKDDKVIFEESRIFIDNDYFQINKYFTELLSNIPKEEIDEITSKLKRLIKGYQISIGNEKINPKNRNHLLSLFKFDIIQHILPLESKFYIRFMSLYKLVNIVPKKVLNHIINYDVNSNGFLNLVDFVNKFFLCSFLKTEFSSPSKSCCLKNDKELDAGLKNCIEKFNKLINSFFYEINPLIQWSCEKNFQSLKDFFDSTEKM